jgi:succinate dehydrogenase / fumarate reductase cytochrome b subunit
MTLNLAGTLRLRMASTITRENFFWHRLHSITGTIPVGFYLLQHLTLNSFSLAGPAAYNSVSGFFYSIPDHIFLGIEVLLVWLPLLFHTLYGFVIISHGETNYFTTHYKWSQNRMYMLQRVSGVFLFVFLCVHFATTTLQVKINHDPSVVDYSNMQYTFEAYGHLYLIFYMLGVLAASYHFSYGLWNFCIRWGITVSARAQASVQKFSFGLFIAVTLLGWLALAGFFLKG